MSDTQQSQPLTLTLIDAGSDSSMGEWRDEGGLVSALSEYGVGLLAELPQEALASNWSPESQIQVCANIRVHVEDKAGAPKMQVESVNKFEDELSDQDKRDIAASPLRTQSAQNDRTTISYQRSIAVAQDPKVVHVCEMLAQLVSFFEGAVNHAYLLRNSACIAEVPKQDLVEHSVSPDGQNIPDSESGQPELLVHE